MDGTEERLMEAVREEVLAYGVRRATATSIATRAGVSRMTLYRRGGGVRQLVLDALSHELQGLVAGLLGTSTAGTARERLVEGVTQAVSRASHAPLVQALRRHDPELLLPYLVDRYGRVQTAVLAWTQAALEEGRADGSVRDLDPRTAAHVLLHATQDLVISAEILDGTAGLVDLEGEVAHLVDAYLAPVADAAGTAGG